MINVSLKSFRLFAKAITSTKHEMWISVQVLFIVTMVLAAILWITEKDAQPEVFGNYLDSVTWSFMWYIGDPGKFADYEPITFLGRVLHVLMAVIKIAIFAVPAGLVANGFRSAIAEDKRSRKLEEYGERMKKSFRRNANKTLREYLNSLADKGGENLKKLNFVPQRIPVARIQIRQGMDIKDIFDVCKKFPEFRLKNQADANGIDEFDEDRFVVEHFPTNRSYGCCINRNSKVTIISTGSCHELGEGWFTYYLAQLGGFNYISKEVEIDPDEVDSFLNLSPEPLYDKKKRKEFNPKRDKVALNILDEKERIRNDFLKDLCLLCKGKNQWAIIITNHVKNAANQTDIHFSFAKDNGEDSTVIDKEKYELFVNSLSEVMSADFNMSTTSPSQRYSLTKNNLLYHLKAKGFEGNGFVMRLSSHLINFEPNKLVVALKVAQELSRFFDKEKGINEEDIRDLRTPGFGYKLNEI